jgi:hypothetical protein
MKLTIGSGIPVWFTYLQNGILNTEYTTEETRVGGLKLIANYNTISAEQKNARELRIARFLMVNHLAATA